MSANTETRAAVGPRGPKVRSDAWVEIELRKSGGLEFAITSKVSRLFGEAIERQVRAAAEALGLEHARVSVEDQGALPFVLDARLMAAAAALGLVGDALLPAALPEINTPSERTRLRRSRLYLPGGQPKFMISAGLYGADGLILDLEDSVAPTEKAAARVLVRSALRFLDWGGAERMVRINPFPEGRADLEMVVGHGAQLILVPKVESADQVVEVADLVAELAAARGCSAPWLLPILESGRGVLAAEAVATAHSTVVGLTIGLEDYTADIGAERTAVGTESFWARSGVVAAAASAGVAAIDSVFSDVADQEGLLAAVREAKALGFVGKGCIHPRQIPVVHRGFAPTDREVEQACRVLRAFADAEERGLSVVSLGSKMIDPPVVRRAAHTVDAAIRTGQLDADWSAKGENVDA